MPSETSDEKWRRVLTGDLPDLEAMKRGFRRIPAAPRCKLCQAPFRGIGGAVLRLTPWRRWQANSTLCSICVGNLDKDVGGAEVEATFLFADIRGSTSVAERLRPADYQALLQRFYVACARSVDAEGGVVDKYLGDGVVALFLPVFSGDGGPAASAIRAGVAILESVGGAPGARAGDRGPWLPVGVGVHTGLAFVGILGTPGGQLDFTGVGDAVNAAARLGAVAAEGELLASTASAERAGLDVDRLERRTLELKGREEPIDVVVVRRGPAAA